ncbi:hypothetical protein [Streptococcus suis]
MNRFEQFVQLLKEMGLPFAYHHFAEGSHIEPPFLIYYYPNRQDFLADGKNYYKITQVRLELYTDRKDIQLEDNLELMLDEAGYTYDKSEVWIASEKLYEVIFTFDMEVY